MRYLRDNRVLILLLCQSPCDSALQLTARRDVTVSVISRMGNGDQWLRSPLVVTGWCEKGRCGWHSVMSFTI